MEELIRKYEIERETIQKLIDHPDTIKVERVKLETVLRFVKGFQEDLRKIETSLLFKVG